MSEVILKIEVESLIKETSREAKVLVDTSATHTIMPEVLLLFRLSPLVFIWLLSFTSLTTLTAEENLTFLDQKMAEIYVGKFSSQVLKSPKIRADFLGHAKKELIGVSQKENIEIPVIVNIPGWNYTNRNWKRRWEQKYTNILWSNSQINTIKTHRLPYGSYEDYIDNEAIRDMDQRLSVISPPDPGISYAVEKLAGDTIYMGYTVWSGALKGPILGPIDITIKLTTPEDSILYIGWGFGMNIRDARNITQNLLHQMPAQELLGDNFPVGPLTEHDFNVLSRNTSWAPQWGSALGSFGKSAIIDPFVSEATKPSLARRIGPIINKRELSHLQIFNATPYGCVSREMDTLGKSSARLIFDPISSNIRIAASPSGISTLIMDKNTQFATKHQEIFGNQISSRTSWGYIQKQAIHSSPWMPGGVLGFDPYTDTIRTTTFQEHKWQTQIYQMPTYSIPKIYSIPTIPTWNIPKMSTYNTYKTYYIPSAQNVIRR